MRACWYIYAIFCLILRLAFVWDWEDYWEHRLTVGQSYSIMGRTWQWVGTALVWDGDRQASAGSYHQCCQSVCRVAIELGAGGASGPTGPSRTHLILAWDAVFEGLVQTTKTRQCMWWNRRQRLDAVWRFWYRWENRKQTGCSGSVVDVVIVVICDAGDARLK